MSGKRDIENIICRGTNFERMDENINIAHITHFSILVGWHDSAISK